jgi:hypothetical protein
MRSGSPLDIGADTAVLFQQPTCSRILASLKPESPRTEEFLLARSGVAMGTYRRWLGELLKTSLVSHVGDGRYVLGPAFRMPAIEICSFEFKLDNWKRAFYQARRYRSFSHRIYVVMPSNTAPRASAWFKFFEKFNIGFITHDPDGKSKRILASRKQQPTSRESVIRALGMLLDQRAGSPALL